MSRKNKDQYRKPDRRESRLMSGRNWIRNYEGKNIIKGYAKRFGVDKLCAIKELEILGVVLSEEYKKQVLDAHKRLIEKRRKKKEEIQTHEPDFINSDENFAFIAGYTSGGAPFGIPWHEQELDIEMDEQDDALPW